MAIEDAAEDHLRHRLAAGEVGEEAGVVEAPIDDQLHDEIRLGPAFGRDARGRVLDLLLHAARFHAVATVHDRDQAEVGVHGPDRVPVLVVERGQAGCRVETGGVGADESVVGEPLELGDQPVGVARRTHRAGEEQPVTLGPEGVVRPTVVRARAGVGDVGRVRRVHHVVEEIVGAEVTEVHELGGDALAIELGHADVEVVQTLPLTRLPEPLRVGDRPVLLAPHQVVEDPHRLGRELVLLFERLEVRVVLLLEVLGPELLGHRGVPVG